MFVCASVWSPPSVSMCVRVRVYVSVWWRSRVDGVWFVLSGVWSIVCCEGVCVCVRGVWCDVI